MRSKELWFVQKNHATITLESSGQLSQNEIENLQRKQNRTVKSTNLKENAGKVKSVFCHQSSPVSRKAWTWPWILQELKKYARKSTCSCDQHWRPFDSSYPGVMNEKSISSDGRNLCPLSCGWRFSNQFDIGVGWALASYTLFVAVPWNGLERFASESKVMCLF